MPDWFGQGPPGAPEEAILDIVCRSPGTNAMHYLDVTVRAAWAQRYVTGSITLGKACATAWREKKARYPKRGGVSVVPLAMETLGRVHVESAAWMRAMANDLSRRAGRPQAGRTLYRRWRAEQERALVFVEADMCITRLRSEAKRLATRVGGRGADTHNGPEAAAHVDSGARVLQGAHGTSDAEGVPVLADRVT